MTRADEVRLLQEHLATCARLSERFDFNRALIAPAMPITGDRLQMLSTAEESDILAFLKRFEQFEDALHRTLKVVAVVMAFGKTERLTPRDVAQRAVSLGIVDDPKPWSDAVRARNTLAHEYPLNADKQAEQVNGAWAASPTLVATWHSIAAFVARERLEHGEL